MHLPLRLGEVAHPGYDGGAMDSHSATRLADVVLEQAAGQCEFEIDMLDEEATNAVVAALQHRGCTVLRSDYKTVLTVRLPAAKLDVN